jgi:hypothetical protein
MHAARVIQAGDSFMFQQAMNATFNLLMRLPDGRQRR